MPDIGFFSSMFVVYHAYYFLLYDVDKRNLMKIC